MCFGRDPAAGLCRFAVVLWVLVASVLALGKPAGAQADLYKGTVTGLSCDNDASFCSGFLAGYDGTALDVDLALPATDTYPLIVVIHGWGGSKGSNSPSSSYPGDAFFTERGYAVMRYSARGFGKSWGQTHLASLDVEIQDLKSLISQVVDDPRFNVLPDRIGVVGASYGGAHCYLIATQPTWTSASGTPVRVATTVPIVPWSDLLYALLPNGRPYDSAAVVGTAKLSYLTALYFGGMRDDPQRPYPNYIPLLHEMYLRIMAGEPYEAGGIREPLMEQMVRQLTRVRSAAWQREALAQMARAPVPLFNIQGWTDDLFPAVEAVRMYRLLKAANPDYPIKLYLGDIGHPRAANKPAETSALYDAIIAWFDYWLQDVGAQPSFDVTAATTTPGATFDPALVVRADDPDQFADRIARLRADGPFILTNPAAQPGGIAGDPLIAALAARLIDPLAPTLVQMDQLGGGIVVRRPVRSLSQGKDLWYFGQGAVRFDAEMAGTDVQYDVRLWDQAPDGRLRLVDRGTFKYVGPPGAARVTVPLSGNAWIFPENHWLLLELASVDFPFLRPNNLASTTVVEDLVLELPTRSRR